MTLITSLNNAFLDFFGSSALGKETIRRLGESYLAGHSLEEGLKTVRRYEKRGIYSTIDILGERAKTKEEADRYLKGYADIANAVNTINALKENTTENTTKNTTISVKPSSLCVALLHGDGISFSDETPFLPRLINLLKIAREKGVHATLDMEDHRYTEATLRTAQCAWERGYTRTGIVLQSRLHRTEQDINVYLRQPRYCFPKEDIRVRLCIGIYQEPKEVAVTTKREAKKRLLARLEDLLETGVYVELATHDSAVITEAQAIFQRKGIPADRYEFQFLKGVPLAEQKIIPQLRDEGKTCRLYLPLELKEGDGIPYMLRRCQANPGLAWYGIKKIFF